MNAHRCAVTLLALCCAIAPSRICHGQDALPGDVKTAADPAPFESQIQEFVQVQSQKLANADDPSAQSQARDALTKAVDDASASPAFLDAYARTLNTALLELAGHENMRVRLNAAIVAARVAEKAKNHRLAEVAGKFLQDRATPVVMWGMTTAKWVMPAIMGNQMLRQNHPLPGELVPALKNHPAGPVVQDTYDALGLGIFQAGNTVPPGIDAAVPLMLELINYRVDLYIQDIPEEPWADQKAGFFFQNRGVWQVLKPDQRVAAIQALSNLISVAGQQARNASDVDREQLVELLRQLSVSIGVIANDYLQHQDLRNAATLIQNIDKNTSPAEIKQRVDRLYPQIIQIGALKGVQGPPVIGAKPASAPAAASGGPPAAPATDDEPVESDEPEATDDEIDEGAVQ